MVSKWIRWRRSRASECRGENTDIGEELHLLLRRPGEDVVDERRVEPGPLLGVDEAGMGLECGKERLGK